MSVEPAGRIRWRWLLVAVWLVLATLAVLQAAVLGLAGRHPEVAAAFWPTHPLPRTQLLLGQIGGATASGRTPPATVIDQAQQLARAAPLASTPFIIKGTKALADGEGSRAELLLREGLRRDPRSLAGRYLLAAHYARSGRLADSLAETARIARRYPPAIAAVAPAIAAEAAEYPNPASLAPLLDRYPDLRSAVLLQAAQQSDVRTALLLAGPEVDRSRNRPWQDALLERLVGDERYEQAYALWQRFHAVPSAAFSSRGFLTTDAGKPPFGWQYEDGPKGSARPAGAQAVSLVTFGRDDVVLARRLFLLKPGHWTLSYRLEGSRSNTAFSWRLRCLSGSNEVTSAIIAGPTSWTFTVPEQGCKAQQLELRTGPLERAELIEAQLSSLSLRPSRP